ncbi:MAG: alpha/beta fold hydrolase [Pseudomonadales bacterium]
MAKSHIAEQLEQVRQEARTAVAEDAAESTVALNPVIGVNRNQIFRAVGSTAFQMLKQPTIFAKHTAKLTAELVDIVAGNSGIAPDKKDRRYADPAFSGNPVYKIWMQSHLAWQEAVLNWVADTDLSENGVKRAQFILNMLADATAPTNSLLGNPAAARRILDTGGRSLINGVINFLDDVENNGGMPAQVDKSKFDVGENLACSEGAVVFRNDFLELIQYSPRTSEVYSTPIMVLPPQINKFYFMDLTPEKSMIQHMTGLGHQIFMVSWRNPTEAMRHWGLDEYISALKEAIIAVQNVSKSEKINLMGPCSGGITASILTAHLDALGNSPINSVTLLVCVLSQQLAENDLGMFTNAAALERVRAKSKKKGILSGKELASTFSWMRPNDLVWNYVANNYLMGNKPPAFDVLYWNNDSTNLPAQLHSDFIDLMANDPLSQEGAMSVCDTPLNLKAVDVDLFQVGGMTDHITPWTSCYKSGLLYGKGKAEFVMCNSGHIQSLVAAPGNPKSRYFTNTQLPQTSAEWLEGAKENSGSWWDHWDKWLSTRSGKKKTAPKSLGNRKYKNLAAAPGSYVYE